MLYELTGQNVRFVIKVVKSVALSPAFAAANDLTENNNNQYKNLVINVNDRLNEEIKSNILYVRTVDTGSYDGRAGLCVITEDFNVNGIYVSGNTYRTHPIQIFFEPKISVNEQTLLKNYFNFVLEVFREKLDSEFLTTYKYSNAEYTRKYLGLTQVRKLIQTYPHINTTQKVKDKLAEIIEKKDFNRVLGQLEACKKKSN